MTILRHSILAAMCVLICLCSKAFSQPASPGPTPKPAGEIDNKPITLTLDVTKPGRTFAGIGGNFRLQNPTSDPPVIEYNLENLRVAWGRVAMPWNVWQPDENTDPIEAAKAGQINQNVRQSMEMAQKLAQRKIPFIISIWAPPSWALQGGSPGGRSGGGGGENQPPQPTQRFWNLKQLGSTPAGSFYLPVTCDGSAVACVAFGDIANGVYAVHLVNNGAARPATLTGLPANLRELRVYVTDSQRGMKEGDRIPATSGTTQFTLDTASYTTLIGGQ